MAATPQLKHVWATTIKDEFGSSGLVDSQTILGSNKFVENILVPAGTSAEIDCGTIDRTLITSMYITCNKAVDVATNNANASLGQAITLSANKAYGWHNNMPTSVPITADISKIFVTNNGIEDATFRVDILLDLLV